MPAIDDIGNIVVDGLSGISTDFSIGETLVKQTAGAVGAGVLYAGGEALGVLSKATDSVRAGITVTVHSIIGITVTVHSIIGWMFGNP